MRRHLGHERRNLSVSRGKIGGDSKRPQANGLEGKFVAQHLATFAILDNGGVCLHHTLRRRAAHQVQTLDEKDVPPRARSALKADESQRVDVGGIHRIERRT